MQLLITDVAGIAGFAFEDDGGFVSVFFQVTVDAVVTDVHGTVGKPLEMRCLAVVQSDGERCLPVDVLSCLVCPETFVIIRRLLVQGLQVIGFQPGFCGEFRSGFKQTVFG